MKSVFLKIFPKITPIELILEHADILFDLSKKMEILIDLYLKDEDITELVKYISKKESEADDIKFKVREELSKNIKLPFTRKELNDYLSKQEKLIDLIEDVAKKLSLNKVEGFDEQIKDDVRALTKEVVKSLEILDKMIFQIRQLIDTSFSKKILKKEEKENYSIEKIEGKVDKCSLKIAKWLYSKKHELNPVDIIFFREFIRLLNQISDIAENTAELLNLFIK